jgi:hypothetical protein
MESQIILKDIQECLHPPYSSHTAHSNKYNHPSHNQMPRAHACPDVSVRRCDSLTSDSVDFCKGDLLVEKVESIWRLYQFIREHAV